MLNRLIEFSLKHRTIVMMAALVLLAAGIHLGRKLPVEVLPDLTKPTVTILTEAPGLAPEEVESRISIPLESALMGVSGVTRLRATSDVALSLIYVEFDWGTDLIRARQFVQERLQAAIPQLPEGIFPYMTPVASLMGEIMLVGLHSPTQEVDGKDLRTLADWTIRRRIQSIPGIAEVLSMGGGVRQIHIQPDPDRMRALGVDFDTLLHASHEAAGNTTGGFLTSRPQEIMVRHLAMTTDLNAIGKTVVRHLEDRSVLIEDVADVVWDVEPMRGDAAVNGIRGVIMSVTKAPGFDTIDLTRRVESAIDELQANLPDNIRLEPLFRQSDFIENAVGNLKEAILDGGIMVSLVLFLFLLNLRTTFITLMAIPLSFACTLLLFHLWGLSVNSMTLGGLASPPRVIELTLSPQRWNKSNVQAKDSGIAIKVIKVVLRLSRKRNRTRETMMPPSRMAILDGGIMVSLVLFLFLLNLRTTFITLMAIPLSFACTLLLFHLWGLSVNSMTLGGLASPPRVIELTLSPQRWNKSNVQAKDSGIAIKVIKVVLRLSRKRNRTRETMMPPSRMASFRLPTAFSIKSDCRNNGSRRMLSGKFA